LRIKIYSLHFLQTNRMAVTKTFSNPEARYYFDKTYTKKSICDRYHLSYELNYHLVGNYWAVNDS